MYFMHQFTFSIKINPICQVFSAAFVCTSVFDITLAKIFRFSVFFLLLLLIVKQTQQQTSQREEVDSLNVKLPAVLMLKSQSGGRWTHSAALHSFSPLAARQPYLCSSALFSPEKEL